MAQLNDWLSIDKISGTGDATITLTASSYQELADRTATIKVQGIGTNAILTVRQKAFILSNDYFWIEFEETDGTVNIENSNVSYSFDGDTWVNGAKSISMGKNKLVYLKDLKTSLKPIYDNIRFSSELLNKELVNRASFEMKIISRVEISEITAVADKATIKDIIILQGDKNG